MEKFTTAKGWAESTRLNLMKELKAEPFIDDSVIEHAGWILDQHVDEDVFEAFFDDRESFENDIERMEHTASQLKDVLDEWAMSVAESHETAIELADSDSRVIYYSEAVEYYRENREACEAVYSEYFNLGHHDTISDSITMAVCLCIEREYNEQFYELSGYIQGMARNAAEYL